MPNEIVGDTSKAGMSEEGRNEEHRDTYIMARERLAAFLFLLMRDEVPTGLLEDYVQRIERAHPFQPVKAVVYQDGARHLGNYAHVLTARLLDGYPEPAPEPHVRKLEFPEINVGDFYLTNRAASRMRDRLTEAMAHGWPYDIPLVSYYVRRVPNNRFLKWEVRARLNSIIDIEDEVGEVRT